MGEEKKELSDVYPPYTYSTLPIEDLETMHDLKAENLDTILSQLESQPCSVFQSDFVPPDPETTELSPEKIIPRDPPTEGGKRLLALEGVLHNSCEIGFHRTPPFVLATTIDVVKCILNQNGSVVNDVCIQRCSF